MSCDCDNPARVWDERHVTARKTYACEECHHPIGKGEVYARVGALHDGGWGTFVFCLFCRAFAAEAQRAGVCCSAIGEFYSDVLGWLHETSFKRVTVGSRTEFVRMPALYREGDDALLRDLHGAEVHEQ